MRTFSFNLALVLDRLAAVVPPFVYGVGVIVLLAKVMQIPSPIASIPPVPLLAGVFAIALLAGMFRRRWRWFTAATALAWLDLRNHAGGAIIAGDAAALRAARVLPGVSFKHLLRRLILPVLFVAAAVVVPAPAPAEKIAAAGVNRRLAQVEQTLAAAEEASALPKPDREELKKQLAQLRELAERNPEAAAEALASLADRVEAAQNRRLQRGAAALEKALDAFAEMEGAQAGTASETGAAESMAEMFQALDRLAKNEGGVEELPSGLREALRQAMREGGAESLSEMAAAARAGGSGDSESMQRLLQALAESGAAFAEAAERAGSNGAGGMSGEPGSGAGTEGDESAGMGGEGGESGMGTASGQLRSLREMLDSLQTTGLVVGETGAGGVNRGPGDAPLTFGDESESGGARFDYNPLPVAPDAPPGVILKRERAGMPDNELPDEAVPTRRSGVVVADRVFAGENEAQLGPERSRAAENYFRSLRNTENN